MKLRGDVQDEKKKGPQTLLEMILVVAISILLFFFVQGLTWALYFLPLTYVLIERRVRKRGWQEIGLKHADFLSDLKSNWYLFLLVAIVIQLLVVIGSRLWWPALFNQFMIRVEFLVDLYGQIAPFAIFFLLIALATLLEEVVYRGLIQERLGWFVGDRAAIIVASLVMAMVHLTFGEPLAMSADFLLVFLDSILYGLIYARSRNIAVAWIAHLAADYMSLILILL
ncbi:MAG: CPBP family intramembrane glutamic endopeptidase [Candidatus Thorarchaeota archaeon]